MNAVVAPGGKELVDAAAVAVKSEGSCHGHHGGVVHLFRRRAEVAALGEGGD